MHSPTCFRRRDSLNPVTATFIAKLLFQPCVGIYREDSDARSGDRNMVQSTKLVELASVSLNEIIDK